ncbi:MAG: phosphatase PAP2 family protein [Oscillibacter sp.]|nr:phosphatase PAP2 family protein [Oscillibacter sp.]
MEKQSKQKFLWAVCLLAAFVLWTLAVIRVDVQAIGPEGSSVGFAALNGAFHTLTGVHLALYNLTDLLEVVPLGIVLGFGVLGLVQLIQRKSLLKVDYSILVLGGFYVLVFAAYMLFEVLALNYRPVLIEGVLEASYPSSTTLLVLCVMPTAVSQLNSRIHDERLKRGLACVIVAYTALMVFGRLVSGVHWLTDIIGGALLAAGLVTLYNAALSLRKA